MANTLVTEDQAPGGVAVADPPSSAATVLMPALQPTPAEHLPAVLDVADEPIELGTALGLAVVDRTVVHSGPIAGMVVNADGSRLLVANYGDDSVSVIDPATGQVVAITETGEPFAIAMSSAAERAYVSTASPACDAIAVIDTDTGALIATHRLALSVRDLAVGPHGKVFALRTGERVADVAVLDPATDDVDVIDLADLPAEATAECLAVSPDGQRLYIGAQRPSGFSDLLVVDRAGGDLVETIEIGSAIRDIAISPDGETLYVASDNPDLGGVVDIIDAAANAIAGTVEVGGLLTQLTLSNDGERAYVVAGDGVTVVCTLTYQVIGAVTVDASPSCVVESPDGQHLYIADYAGVISVVSITSTEVSLVANDTSSLLRELDWALA